MKPRIVLATCSVAGVLLTGVVAFRAAGPSGTESLQVGAAPATATCVTARQGGLRVPGDRLPKGFRATSGGLVENPGLDAVAETPTIATTYEDPADASKHVTVVTGASDALENLVPANGQRRVTSEAGPLTEFPASSSGALPMVAVPGSRGAGLWRAVVLGEGDQATDLQSAAAATAQGRATPGRKVASSDISAFLGLRPSLVETYVRETDGAQMAIQTVAGASVPAVTPYLGRGARQVRINGCQGVLVTLSKTATVVTWDTPNGMVVLTATSAVSVEELISSAEGARP